MSDKEPKPTEDEIKIAELFGSHANSLREELEKRCPELVLNYGLDNALLGFVPDFFHDHVTSKSPDFPDVDTRAEVIRQEIERYETTMDNLTSQGGTNG